MISRNSIGDAYPKKRLRDVVTFLDSMRRPVTESDRRTGLYPYYGANGVQGTIDDYIFDEPLVLLAEDGGHFGNPERGIAYCVSGKTWVNNHAHVLRPNAGIDLRFLWRVLENYDVTPWVTGTTRGKLTQAGASEIEVPVPPFPEQRRIADILDRADALRAKRRAALAELDTLRQYIFLNMFGDPAANPKGWPLRRLSEVSTKFSDGPFGSNLKTEHYSENGIRVIRLQNIGIGKFVNDNAAYITSAHFSTLKKHECLPGDVLVATLGDPNLRACIQPESLPVAINKADCVQIRADVTVATPAFISALLNQPSAEGMARALMHGQTRVRISMGNLRSIKFPVPPIAKQREFASRIESVERLRHLQLANHTEIHALFASLQNRAFRGVL